MPNYLILFAQKYETFRKVELAALAKYKHIDVDLSKHNEDSPFLIVSLTNDKEAELLIERSILIRGIFQLWGKGNTLEELHQDVKKSSSFLWKNFETVSFKFEIFSYKGSRPKENHRELINSFSYLNFKGPIDMKNPKELFGILEEYDLINGGNDCVLKQMFFGRFIASGQRHVADKYDLKKRKYIGTTSFDAELSLVTTNIALTGPGSIMYDPFAGTGSFLIAGAHFGSLVTGSDLDGRQLRGNKKANILSNFKQYNLERYFLDDFTCDFTHNPLRPSFKLDSIVCDPPYGVREGLKVLGSTNEAKHFERELRISENGVPVYKLPDYIPPKKPYSFDKLINDLLQFSANHLIIGGRLCFWMPLANEDIQMEKFPQNPQLNFLDACVQKFNKWSRVLLVYERVLINENFKENVNGSDASFRQKYFKGFRCN